MPWPAEFAWNRMCIVALGDWAVFVGHIDATLASLRENRRPVLVDASPMLTAPRGTGMHVSD